MELTTMGVDPSCQACADGSANVTVVGGQPPYTYRWQPGEQTAATATGLATGEYTVRVTDTIGCFDDVSVVIGNVGIGDWHGLEIKMGPNPTKGEMSITGLPTGEHISISIFNHIGELVFEENIGVSKKTNHKVDISNLQNGVYWINYKLGNSLYSKKIILHKW